MQELCNFDGKGYQWWEFRYTCLLYTSIAVNGWKDESSCELFPFLENYMDKGEVLNGAMVYQTGMDHLSDSYHFMLMADFDK